MGSTFWNLNGQNVNTESFIGIDSLSNLQEKVNKLFKGDFFEIKMESQCQCIQLTRKILWIYMYITGYNWEIQELCDQTI